MQLHTAKVRCRRIAWNRREVVQHGLNADAVVLDLDEEWRECDRIQAVLAGAGGPIRILAEGGRFNLPSALMEAPGAIRMCLMGHVGEAVRIVTAKEAAPLTVVESGEMGGADPAPEQPDLWATLMEEVRKATEGAKTAAQSATRAEADLRAAAERGDFDGEDGKTPVRGVDYWTEADRKPIEDATDAALTSAGKADAAAEKASVGEASRAASEVERVTNEAERVEAESGRKSAEATRAANESERTEAFNANLTSWNSKVDAACKKATDTASKAAQDAKTATDAAIAKTEGAINAAVAKAQTATDNATTAANKAEAAVAQLPVPSGNVLKGEAESTFINLHDSWKAPILKGKVLGQSNQATTTGKNLIKLDEAIKTSQGLELDIKSSGQLSINGTCTGGGLWLKIGTVDVVEGKTYYLSLNKPFPSFGISAWSDTDNKHVIFASSKLQVAKGVAAKTETLSIFAVGGNNTTFNNELVYVQIEEGQKTNWEPCTGCKPSPSPDYPQEITNLNKAEIVTTGKNLLEIYSLPNQPDSGISASMENDKSVIVNGMTTSSNIDIKIISENTRVTLLAGVYTFSVDSIGFPKDCIFFIRNASDNTWFANTNVEKPTITISLDKPTIISECSVRIPTAGTKFSNARIAVQLEVGGKATGYTAPATKALTPIDLKGNELCSLPNGVKDEVVIDAEGNVSLIKRTKQYDWNCAQIIKGTGRNYAVDKVLDIGANYTGLVAEKAINAVNNTIGICYVNQKMIYVTVPESVTTKEQANQLCGGMKVIYQLAEPQTIPLGKVELPALPEATSNIWNDGNIPANVYINYLKDINIAYADLENQIKQITLALSVMDTPTIIPEI